MIHWEEMRQTYAPESDRESAALEYASGRRTIIKTPDAASRRKEQERMLEEITPALKELMRKVLKEERDYYKSRPSLAAKYYSGIFPAGGGESRLADQVSTQVYQGLEARMRREWIRKGKET